MSGTRLRTYIAVEILVGGPFTFILLDLGPRIDTHPSGEISSFLIFTPAFFYLEIMCQFGDLGFLEIGPVGRSVRVVAA